MGGEGPGDGSSPIQIVEADLRLPEHQEAVLAMVDAYSRDAMGEAKPLDPDVRARLIPGLQKHPTTLIFLALDGNRPEWEIGSRLNSESLCPPLSMAGKLWAG